MADLRLLFTTDLHGSEAAFRKFVNAGLVPVIKNGNGYVAEFNGSERRAETTLELEELERTIRLSGQYPFRTNLEEYEHLRAHPQEVDERFRQAMCASLSSWFDLAADRLSPLGVTMAVIAGNDDPFVIDEVLERHSYVQCVDGRVASVDGVELVGFGGSNPTPWHSPREFSEDEIEERLRRTVEQVKDVSSSIWNVHVPPHGSGLDTAPEVDSNFSIVRVGGQPHNIFIGSVAVRKLIEEYQPGIGLHGHVHESRGIGRIGRSVIVNPGSEYTEGVLRAALVRRHPKKGYQVQVISG